ncbi:hypothetical protein Q5P01_020213 [Channa striata]|uniref:Uncharacterized protein n=1 Tax=Channa striata TaxID=64152 RepID=A0AA88S323_CHASR|nr:hypothetical protein Q5P01_020213 [Channa striata]
MKKEEQRSSFITMAINNANSTAAAVEAGEQEGVETGTEGCEGWDSRGQTVRNAYLSPVTTKGTPSKNDAAWSLL